LLQNPVVNEIADRLGKTAAQVLLRYNFQHGVVSIPKSTNAGRLRQNIEIFDFELSDEDVGKLAKLDAGIRLVDFKNFSFFKGIESHAEYPF
jgi:diketogulonate reductase-like aldo/keto reductase